MKAEQSLQVFNHPQFGSLRMEDDGKMPWFVADDVCKALGYINTPKAISDHCDEADVTKRYTWVTTGTKADGTPAQRKTQTNFINESGLYSLIFGSKLPKAKAFKKWVTSEVLPTLRKTGTYTIGQTKPDGTVYRLGDACRERNNKPFPGIRDAKTQEESEIYDRLLRGYYNAKELDQQYEDEVNENAPFPTVTEYIEEYVNPLELADALATMALGGIHYCMSKLATPQEAYEIRMANDILFCFHQCLSSQYELVSLKCK